MSKINNVRDFWNRVGNEDPFWGVLTQDQYRDDTITDHDITVFYESGQLYCSKLESIAHAYNVDLLDCNVIDFGSGVGRVGSHMISKCDTLYCIDISKSYLSRCGEKFGKLAKSNYRLIEYDQFYTYDFENVGMIYSFITLQHNHPDVIIEIIDRMCDILKSGGIGVIDVPYYIDNWKYVGQKPFYDDNNYLRGMDMNPVSRDNVINTLENGNCEVLDCSLDRTKTVRSCMYTFRKC